MAISDLAFGGSLAFLLGLASTGFNWPAAFILGATATVGFVLLVLLRQLKFWKYSIFFAVLIFAGVFYYHFRANLTETRRSVVFGEELEFLGTVVAEPRGFEKYQIITLRAEPPFSGKIALFALPLSQIKYGDFLKIKGAIEPPSSVGKTPTVFFPEIEIVGRGGGNNFKHALLKFKTFLVNQFNKHLGPDESALLSGITFGVRSAFSEKFREAMAKSGTTHIVALSGYNITILILSIAYTLGFFLPRRKTFYLTGAAIVFFVLMVGGEPSIVRAAIMGFLALLAKEVGRVYDMRNAIAFTALAMTVIEPAIIANDAGFQLSFASLLGIVYLSPVLKNLLHMEGEGFAAWKENLVLTLSAQLAVLPIIVNTFGEFSLMAILANILILGFIPLTMLLGFLLAALSSIYFYMGLLVGKMVELLLGYEIWIMEIFSKISLPVTAPPIAPAAFLVGYYLLLGFFVYHFSRTSHASSNG